MREAFTDQLSRNQSQGLAFLEEIRVFGDTLSDSLVELGGNLEFLEPVKGSVSESEHYYFVHCLIGDC